MGYLQGVQVGKEEGHPLEGLLSAIAKPYKRREEERKKQAEEDRALVNELTKLTAMEKVKSKYKQEEEIQKGLISGDIEEVTGREVSDKFQGTPFEAFGKKYARPKITGTAARTEEEARTLIPKTDYPEDYNIKPVIRTEGGVVKTIYTPEKKPRLSSDLMKELKQVRETRQLLERNLQKATTNPKYQEFLGPGIIQRPGAIADILGQTGLAPNQWNVFKADVDKAFQKYRKEVTGVQAGYPELQWLAADMPKGTDKWEIFKGKSESSIEQLNQAEQDLLDIFNKSGYSTGELRKGLGTTMKKQPIKKTITLPSGKTITIGQ